MIENNYAARIQAYNNTLDRNLRTLKRAGETFAEESRAYLSEGREYVAKLRTSIETLLVDEPPLTIEVTPKEGTKKLTLSRVTPDPDSYNADHDRQGERSYAGVRGSGGYIILTPRTLGKLAERRVVMPGVLLFEQLERIKVVDRVPTDYEQRMASAEKVIAKAEEAIKKKYAAQEKMKSVYEKEVNAKQLRALFDSQNLARVKVRKPVAKGTETQPEMDSVAILRSLDLQLV